MSKHILKTAFSDFKEWYIIGRHKPKTGYIYGYVACTGQPFGSGKTLSCIVALSQICDKYNSKHFGKYTIHINILSNIPLNFSNCSEFKEITSIDDISAFLDEKKSKMSVEPYALEYTYILLDEIGSEFNSRSFMKNFSSDFLTKLVTVRHYNCSIFWTAQNFDMPDVIFRRLTTKVFVCKHKWRFYTNLEYSPSDFENYSDVLKLRPFSKFRFFASAYYFDMYDSFASFQNIKDKSLREDYKALSYAPAQPSFSFSSDRVKKRDKKKLVVRL